MNEGRIRGTVLDRPQAAAMPPKERCGLVACELGELEQVTEQLLKSVHELTELLSPILSAEDMPCAPEVPEPMLPPLASRLRDTRKRVLAALDKVNSMNRRVEL